jgi:hypothetical protein
MGNINHEEGISKNNKMLLLSAGAVYVVITTCKKDTHITQQKKHQTIVWYFAHY